MWGSSLISVPVIKYSGKKELREKGLIWFIVPGSSPSRHVNHSVRRVGQLAGNVTSTVMIQEK